MQTIESTPSFRPVTPPPIFDTLVYARRMEEVGFTRQQAERLAEEQAKLIDERLVTKSDIAEVKASIERLRIQFCGDIEQQRIQLNGTIEQQRIQLNGTIEQQRIQLSGDIDKLRIEIKGDIEKSADKTKLQMVLWFLGISAAQLATLAGLTRLHL